ncbi:MAG: HD domain-containing protein [Firmicutes bacterium]|nr:HD domain-containing protein [Bacillota bacterium]
MAKVTAELKREHAHRQSWVIGFGLVCLAINLILSKIVSVMGLPIYLDTVGTVLSAIFSGYLPGILVGLLTNLIKGITDDAALYYGVMNVLIAIVARFLYRQDWLKSVPMGMLYIMALAGIGGGLGGLLPVWIEGLPSGGIWSDIVMDCIDKTITVQICMLFLWLMPASMREKVKFQTWYQNPITPEMKKELKRIEHRSFSMRTKTMAMLAVAMLAIGSACISISYILYHNTEINYRTQLASGTAKTAASMIDPEMVDYYLAHGYAAEGYVETAAKLKALLESSPLIKYIYAYRIEEDGSHVVFDMDTETLAGEKPGSVIPLDEAFDPYMDQLLAGKKVPPMISNGRYGWLLMVYQPVYDKDGRCACYVAADVSMVDMENHAREFFMEMIFLFLGFFILVLAIGFWVTEYNIILPVNAMALSTNIFAKRNDADIEEGIKRMDELGIITGDEVENLYHSLCKMTHDTANYIADIESKTETIQKMQNALILVLADMVESRDQNTGAHVKKTAAYAKIIMLKMREMGYFTEVLTDKFISDVEHSAPLHDVGKITVPDAILNKNGKLEDDEFVIMKNHTTEGEKIINRVIEQVPDSDFLKYARDLAKYHHEKWDGSGYPTGISKEDIPLVARVMAVADVFDALTSKRSYKPPFTYEKAMEIIEAGSGTHFDPMVVEAFKACEQEVRKIQESFEIYNR